MPTFHEHLLNFSKNVRKLQMAQIIEIVDEESRSAERKQIEQLQTENATLRLKVDRMQREETEASTSR